MTPHERKTVKILLIILAAELLGTIALVAFFPHWFGIL